jgi:hypothetical protein
MKTTKLLTGTFAIAAALLVSGCQSARTTATTGAPESAESTSVAAAGPRVTSRAAAYDTTALVTAFRTSDIPSNQMVSATVNAINSRNFSAAVSELQKLIRYPGLTAPQETAVRELLGKLQS